MRRFVHASICGAVLSGLGVNLFAATPDPAQDRYQNIRERNVFGLKSAPREPEPQREPVQLPNIILTGITTILGNKRAVLKLQPAGAKPGDISKEESFILTEGQREGVLEVQQIDEKAGTVRIVHSGTPITLSFEKNGPKLLNTPPLPTPGVPTPTGTIPMAGLPANTYQQPSALTTIVTNRYGVPTRTFRLPQRTTPAATNAVAGQPALTVVPTPQVITNFVAPLPTAPAHAAQERPLTAEEQAVLAEVQRAMNNSAAPAEVPGTPAVATPNVNTTPVAPPASIPVTPVAPASPYSGALPPVRPGGLPTVPAQ